MLIPEFTILYVKDVAHSIRFYDEILGANPMESSPNFAIYKLENGVLLGLWSIADVQPPNQLTPGGVEIAFSLKSKDEVDTLFRSWSTRGYVIAQKPVEMDFGYTFLALDPDGHRLRIYVPAKHE